MESREKKILVLSAIVSSLLLVGCTSNDKLDDALEQQNQQAEQITELEGLLVIQQGEMDILAKEVNRLSTIQEKIIGDIQIQASTYTVKQNDTLSKIAEEFDMTVEDLISLNPEIKNSNTLLIGQNIRLK